MIPMSEKLDYETPKPRPPTIEKSRSNYLTAGLFLGCVAAPFGTILIPAFTLKIRQLPSFSDPKEIALYSSLFLAFPICGGLVGYCWATSRRALVVSVVVACLILLTLALLLKRM
jgi:hypothetical protein